MTKGTTYRSRITAGDGRQHHAGDWRIVTLTAKTVKVKMVRKPETIWGDGGLARGSKVGDIATLSRENKSPHVLRDWEDGTFTVYANRDGTPQYFEPLHNQDSETS